MRLRNVLAAAIVGAGTSVAIAAPAQACHMDANQPDGAPC